MLCKPVAPCALRCARSALSLPARPALCRPRPRLRAVNGSSDGSSSSSSSSSPGKATPVEQATAGSAAALAATPAAGTSPFLDPLVRSLLLGVGAGIMCETVHVILKAVTLVEAGSLLQPFSTDFMQQFSPTFVADHAVAIGTWILLYAVEAAAIAALANRNTPGGATGTTKVDPLGIDASWLSSALSALPSRKMFPAPLTPVKDALAHTLAGATAAASTISGGIPNTTAAGSALASELAQQAAAPAQLVAAPPGLSKELEKALEEIEAAAAGSSSSGSSAGSSVLEPPVKQDTPKKKQLKQQQAAEPIKSKEGLKKSHRQQQQQQQQQEEERVEEARWLSKRDQELRDRKAYLKNFWYAAALSEKVKDKPVGVNILGTRITLFRDEAGKVVAIDDTCPHRGAPLSDGWTAIDKETGKNGMPIEGGFLLPRRCVVCPYHGWAFDAKGKLRDVPSAEHGSWPKRPLVGAYAVEERGGFVWLFYGSKSMPAEEGPPIPCTPELEDPNWRAVYGEIEFDCGHWSVFENAIDMAHIHYLHADSFGNSEKPKVMEMQSERDTFATTCTFRIHNKPINKLWEWTAVPSVPVTAKAMLPSTSAVTIELAHGVKMITFVNTVPIDEKRAINRFCLIRNFATNPAFDFMARDNMYKILGEDKVMVDKLAPERLEAEYSLAPDLPQIAFRQLRQEWINMGYGVPPESEVPRRGLLPKGY